jgi:sugar phosphate isomerase/epimerase
MTTQDPPEQSESSIDSRLGCSNISFRRWPLSGALAQIKGQGFGETDLGSLPGVCDHVPIPLPADRVDELAEQILDSRVTVRLINADVADMDDPDLDAAEMQRRLRTLVELAHAVGTSTIMLPCGQQGTEPRTELPRDIATVARTLIAAAEYLSGVGVNLLVEAPHSRRLCATVERSEMLYDALGDEPVGAVLDFSHVVASGVIARLSSAAVGVPRTVGAVVGDGARDRVRGLLRGVGFGVGLCCGADALGVGEGAREVGDGVESFLLAGAAEIDGCVSTVGLAALRSFTSRAASTIPMPIRATTATAAAKPRLRRGSGGW